MVFLEQAKQEIADGGKLSDAFLRGRWKTPAANRCKVRTLRAKNLAGLFAQAIGQSTEAVENKMSQM
jgi:hypothetical protein